MFSIIEHRDKKAMKPHLCDYCGGFIDKGETYDYQKTIYDGRFYEWRVHLACARVASAIWDYCDPDEGMSDQEFQDGCREVCERFICPDCPEWDEEYKFCNKDETYCIDRMDEFFKTRVLYRAGRQAYYETWKCREKEKKA